MSRSAFVTALVAATAALFFQTPTLADGQAFAINGRVVSVDYAANSMIVRSRGNLLMISVTPTTTVIHDGQVGDMADLRPGTRVRITGITKDNAMTAVSIVVI